MRIILVMDVDDRIIEKEGKSPAEIVRIYQDLEKELASEGPPGTKVTLHLCSDGTDKLLNQLKANES